MVRRIRSAIACIVLVAAARSAHAQFLIGGDGRAVPDTSASAYRVNFAIPDAPAFDLLRVDPSRILRPQSVREVAVAFSGFQSGSGAFRLPQSLAVEFSPGLLIGGDRLTIDDYRRGDPWWYRLRVSVAAQRDSDEASTPARMALGLRLSLIDDSDPRWNSAELLDVGDMVTRINDVAAGARRRIGVSSFDTLPESEADACRARGGIAQRITVDGQAMVRCRTMLPLVLDADEQRTVDALNARIKRMWESSCWNARQLELAAGISAQSRDADAGGTRAQEIAGWGTYAVGYSHWFQWLLGTKVATARDSLTGDFGRTGSLSTRAYAGNNRYKAFVEGQLTARQGRRREPLLYSGLEMHVFASVWATLTGGLEETASGRNRFVTRFKLKAGPPTG